MAEYGWTRKEGKLQVIWEVEENVRRSKANLEFVLGGCKCKQGCSTRRCSCKKKDSLCGPGCQCRNCTNTTVNTTSQGELLNSVEVQHLLEEERNDENADDSDMEYVDTSDDDLDEIREEIMDDEELNEIMHDVFGEDSDEDVL